MKIEYLEIKNYKQFTDLTLDLTYPKGHEKEGKPLDKICIIGQSGTGKTNLLEIIKKSVTDFSEDIEIVHTPFSDFFNKTKNDSFIANKYRTQNNNLVQAFFSKQGTKYSFDSEIETGKKDKVVSILTFLENEKIYSLDVQDLYTSKQIKKKEITLLINDEDKQLLDKFFELKAKALVRKKELKPLATIKIENLEPYKNITNELINIEKSIKEIEEKYNLINNEKFINFINKHIVNLNETSNSWKLLKEKIQNYEQEHSRYIQKLTSKLLTDDMYEKNDFKMDIEVWKNTHENILEKIAKDINSIIKNFNLELQINESTKNYEELIIKDLSNNHIIEYDYLSTGTKSLLSTFIPLKTYNPQDSIILIDEPENSFYPDIQRELTDLYMNVGENNQLIMATHSPLIASSFEPWEVVELKFDKNNQIYREKYYEGENHIDNYTLDPRLLTWTSILVDIFGLKEDSFSLREQKLVEYGMLKAEIKAMEKGEERDEKMKKFKKLSVLLGLQN